jgi:lipoprotein-anchoring transpeptidase ErfK/SrfK
VKTVLILVGVALAFGAAAPSAARSPSVARGVTVGGIKLGGLGSESARTVVHRRFDRPLQISYGSEAWTVRPAAVGGSAAVDRAVAKALRAAPGTRVDLPTAVRTRDVRSYVRYLDHKYSTEPEDARLVRVKGVTPVISEGRPGLRVATGLMEARIATALRSPRYRSIGLATKPVAPKVTRESFGPLVVIGRGSHQLRLYDGPRLVRQFGVATGQAAYPTPLGTYEVVTMQRDPWWIPPPNSEWAHGAKPIPPGPGNPLGTRWMGLSAAAVGIHGTPDAASIGYSASHGCIRMRVPDAEWLFGHVEVGTPVAIVSA